MGPNEQALRAAYARYTNGDLETVIDAFADDCVWTASGDRSRLPFAGEWRGHAGIRGYFAARADWTIREHNVTEIIGQNDSRFAVKVAVDALHKNGARVRLDKVDLVTMANGKCTSYTETFDSALLERALNS